MVVEEYAEEQLGEKRALLKKMGLKESQNFGKIREKVWRPKKNTYGDRKSYWAEVMRRSYDPSEKSLRSLKSLAAQRNRARRK